MEKRAYFRRSIRRSVDVVLWRREGEQIIRCHTKNMSLGGALLDAGGIEFPKFRLLELDFRMPAMNSGKRRRILALAVRQSEEGVAVEFRQVDLAVLRLLHEIILGPAAHDDSDT